MVDNKFLGENNMKNDMSLKKIIEKDYEGNWVVRELTREESIKMKYENNE